MLSIDCWRDAELLFENVGRTLEKLSRWWYSLSKEGAKDDNNKSLSTEIASTTEE